jgi:hypothetical protein
LDAEFYDQQSATCAIAIVEGTNAVLHHTNIVARAQFPDRLNFHGWIAIDPRAMTYLADEEAVAIWVHEIGHLLGLKHNPSPASVMYFIDTGPTSKLDSADLRTLALLHSLRSSLECPMCSISLDKRAGLDTSYASDAHLHPHTRNVR